MPLRNDWIDRIKSVQRACNVMQIAGDELRSRVAHNPILLPKSLNVRDVHGAIAELSDTYIVRLFAEFETGLRQYWATIRQTHPRTRDLLDGLGAARAIPFDMIARAHLVREFRNQIVHERDDEVAAVTLEDCQRHLCTFFSRLPYRW